MANQQNQKVLVANPVRLDAPSDIVSVHTWKLIVLEGPQAGAQIPIQRERYLLGRDETCDLILLDPLAEAQVAEITIHEERLQWRHLAGTPLELNGEQVGPEPIELTPGSILKVGQSSLLVTSVEDPLADLVLPHPSQPGELLRSAESQAEPEAVRESEPTPTETSSKKQVLQSTAGPGILFNLKRWIMVAGTFSMLVILAGFIWWSQSGQASAPTLLSEAESLTIFRGLQGQYPQLKLVRGPQGWQVVGHLATKEEAESLNDVLHLAGVSIPFRLFDNQSMHRELTDIVALHDMPLSVAAKGPGQFSIAGMTAHQRSDILELEDTLQKDVAGLLALDDQVISLVELFPFFHERLTAHRLLGKVRLGIVGGVLTATGNLKVKEWQTWHDSVRKPFEQEYGFAIVDRIEKIPGQRAKPRAKPHLQITGVHLGDSPYLTGEAGAIYFEGAHLPSGHRIRSIHANKVVLTKQGAQMIVPIGGRP